MKMPAGSCHRTSPPCVGCQPTFLSSTSSPRLQTNNYRLGLILNYRLGFLNYRFVVNLYIQNLDNNKNCFIFATKLPTPKQTELSASYMLNTIIFILKYRHIYMFRNSRFLSYIKKTEDSKTVRFHKYI